MKTTLAPTDLAASVIAVPPLCRDAGGRVSPSENARLIRHLEAGGVRLFLYGGNANFYNISLAEYDAVLDAIESPAGADSVIVPSIGPYFGTALDQAALLSQRTFPTAMLLPTVAVSTPEGVGDAVRRLTEVLGRPIVLYVKDEKYITPAIARSLVEAGHISWIKYAVVRADPAVDPLLRQLVDAVDPRFIVSGIGEQPAVVHMRDFGATGFTTGCGCVAPRLSMALLAAVNAGDIARAEQLRAVFRPLEDLRNSHGPIPVLHEAVAAAGLAETGPLQPLLTALPDEWRSAVATAARALLAADAAA